MVSEKIQKRLQLYVKLDAFQKKFDTKTLPAEMGGSIPMATMIDLWKQELAAKRDKLIELDKMQILSTRGILSSKKSDNGCNNSKNELVVDNGISLTGTFRKLEID